MASSSVDFDEESLAVLFFCAAVASINPYLYKSLTKSSEIRLLLLDPGQENEPLVGKLLTWDLNDKPCNYIAISYHWGSSDLSKHIYIDGRRLDITANLHAALRRARFPNKVKVLWADAICVNQRDIAERSTQVGLMQRIYGECMACWIYLGEDADDSQEVPDMIQKLLDAHNRMEHLHIPGCQVKVDVDKYALYSIPDPRDVGWRALRRLLARPWFRRIWVIQEFALPPKVQILCGDWAIEGHLLAKLTWLNSQIVLPDFLGDETYSKELDDLWARRRSATLLQFHMSLRYKFGTQGGNQQRERLNINQKGPPGSHHLDLVDLLTTCRICEAKDPRDRFFALLGLSVDANAWGLVADYSKSIDEVRKEWISEIVQHGDGLKMLQTVAPGDHQQDTLPSWSPNWISYNENNSQQYYLVNANASFESPSSGLDVRLSNKPDQLLVRGYLVDEVLKCATKTMGDKGVMSKSDLLCQKEIDNMVAEIKRYPTGETVSDAKWRAMAASRESPTTARDHAASREVERSIDAQHYAAYREILILMDSGEWSKLSATTRAKKFRDALPFAESRRVTAQARFCVTQKGYFGLVPREVTIGDCIFVVHGFPQAFIVRKYPGSEEYRWMCVAYIHGLFEGEKALLQSGNRTQIALR